MPAVSVTVELFIEDTWTAVTSYVRDDPGVDINFGVAQENGLADPATCTLVLNNRDGRFSPRNTAGAYYPWITRNTPLRVKVGSSTRFCGEVPEWPVAWDPAEADVPVTVTASGILRRLGRSNVLDSTLKSAILGVKAGGGAISGYWPCEDEEGATSVGSALPGGTAGSFTGAPVFASVDPGVMSKPVPTWGAATATFTPAAGSATEFTGFFLIVFPASGLSGGEELIRFDCDGTAASWRLLYSPTSGGGILLQVMGNDGTELHATTYFSDLDGTYRMVKLEVEQNGANVDWDLTADPGFTVSGTINTRTATDISRVKIGQGTIAIPADAPVAIGHVATGTTNVVFFDSDIVDGLTAYAGESVDDRMTRLATQGGISLTLVSGVLDPAEMGAQSDGSLLDAMREAEKADAGGILHDALGDVGLRYITRYARYADAQTLVTIDYDTGHLSMARPTDDDLNIRNDVRANRTAGSTARVVEETGALSIQDYPDGVGPYRFEDTYTTYEDSELVYVAGWIKALGTVDETRWPELTVDLVKNSGLVANFDAIRPGTRLRVTTLPAFAGATSVDLQVIGWSEHISTVARTMTLRCVPETPWNVIQLNDATFGELDEMRLAL